MRLERVSREVGQPRPGLRGARSSGGRVSTVDLAERFDRLAVRLLDRGSARSGQGVSTTAATSRPAARAASIVSSVWLIVPRPGEAAIDQRQPEVDREVADQVVAAERDQQAADPLADEDVGAAGRRGAAAASRRSGSISSPASAAARCGEAGGP